jgi:integrase
MIRSGSVKDATGKKKGLQFRLKLVIPESLGALPARRALAASRLADIVAMRDALVEVGKGAKAEYLMRQAGEVADDEEKFALAIAACNVAVHRPSERKSEAMERFTTWGQLARAWCSQELERMYPNAGFGKKSAESTDEPRVEFICKYIADTPLSTFSDDDYWRAMRPARAKCKTDSTFKQYSQVVRRVLKIACELKILPVWPLSIVCKLPKPVKGSAPEFPFLYPEEYVRLVRCLSIRFEYRVLWGFIIREGLRISEAERIEWHHLSQLTNGRWLLDVPETKTGRALNFVLNAGSGEVLSELRIRMPDLEGPFRWLKVTNVKKAAEDLRKHIELSGTSRERLLFTDGRLRRLREHDLRSTYVTWSKLAGVDNETISQHTGHETSSMIKRYNRGKATIEHLGLAPYLPLHEAIAYGSAEEAEALAIAEAMLPEGEASPRLIGSQAELDALYGAGRAPRFPEAGSPALLGAGDDAAGDFDSGYAPGAELRARFERPAEAAWCPECERPMARVRSGGRSGWSCVRCNAAGDPERDWLEGELLEGEGEGGARAGDGGSCHRLTPGRAHQAPAEHARTGGAGQPVEELHRSPGDARQGLAAPGGALGGLSFPPATASPGDGSRAMGGHGNAPRAEVETGPARGGCDGGCDGELASDCHPIPQNAESSMFTAVCARGDSNSQARRRRNLNPSPSNGNAQNPGNGGGGPVPEGTGNDTPSHPPVTVPEGLDTPPRVVTVLEQLETTARVALRARNWPMLQALFPLIDAEVAREAREAAAAREAEPVRLEVVRARGEGRGQR